MNIRETLGVRKRFVIGMVHCLPLPGTVQTLVEGDKLELAGTGRADPGSLFVAVEQAIDMAQRQCRVP